MDDILIKLKERHEVDNPRAFYSFVTIAQWVSTCKLSVTRDYGSTLQRSKTAKEALMVMVNLMDRYGYASGGESFSLADRSGDVWMMEVIGRGSDYYGEKGAVWVAQKIPDGAVAAHANQARIRTFPRDDPDHCRYASDVVDVAVAYGLYPATADPMDFSFSDVYDPVDFNALLFKNYYFHYSNLTFCRSFH